jgi:hypothetical protein
MSFVVYSDITVIPIEVVSGAALTSRNAMIAAMGAVTHLETFESFAAPRAAPFPIFAGAGSLAPLSGSGNATSCGTNFTPASPPAAFGRFNTTGALSAPTSGKWLQASVGFKITFPAPKKCFGCYITDAGDFDGTFTARLYVVGGATQLVTIPNQNASSNGSLLFWGFVDSDRSFTAVDFNITQASSDPDLTDYLGFDDIFLGDVLSAIAVARAEESNAALALVPASVAPPPSPGTGYGHARPTIPLTYSIPIGIDLSGASGLP